jgi:hypothetical protein
MANFLNFGKNILETYRAILRVSGVFWPASGKKYHRSQPERAATLRTNK